MTMSPTLKKFGYPDTLLSTFEHWILLVRPLQPTLGSLILMTKYAEERYSDISLSAYKEQKTIVEAVETTLRTVIQYEKINYLMLMMVDPEVHFHIIPRYKGARKIGELSIHDKGWPGLPNLSEAYQLSSDEIQLLKRHLSESYRE